MPTTNFQRDLISAPGYRLRVSEAFQIYQQYLTPAEVATVTTSDFVRELREAGEIVGAVEGKQYIANRLLPKGLYVDCGGSLRMVNPHFMVNA